VICERKEHYAQDSYTCYLFEKGLDKILKKVGEESAETVIAAKNGVRLADLLRRPGVGYADLAPFDPERPALPREITESVEISIKYAGYIARQTRQVEEMRRLEGRALPPGLDYAALGGLRLEARQKLAKIKPLNLGQASRISGVSPADVAVLMIWLEKIHEP
jgi:tRNA uridine 5-carboxymethylaminomethyl modification enzyme